MWERQNAYVPLPLPKHVHSHLLFAHGDKEREKGKGKRRIERSLPLLFFPPYIIPPPLRCVDNEFPPGERRGLREEKKMAK
jgi:hypothetical protein